MNLSSGPTQLGHLLGRAFNVSLPSASASDKSLEGTAGMQF